MFLPVSPCSLACRRMVLSTVRHVFSADSIDICSTSVVVIRHNCITYMVSAVRKDGENRKVSIELEKSKDKISFRKMSELMKQKVQTSWKMLVNKCASQ
jgi:hypothetical protein